MSECASICVKTVHTLPTRKCSGSSGPTTTNVLSLVLGKEEKMKSISLHKSTFFISKWIAAYRCPQGRPPRLPVSDKRSGIRSVLGSTRFLGFSLYLKEKGFSSSELLTFGANLSSLWELLCVHCRVLSISDACTLDASNALRCAHLGHPKMSPGVAECPGWGTEAKPSLLKDTSRQTCSPICFLAVLHE